MAAQRPTILATSMGFNRSGDPWRPSPVFRYAFDLAGGPARPRVCFLTTGTGDRQTSIDAFHAAFAGSGVVTSHLALFDKPNVPNPRELLLDQDVIWVDRGSVINLLAVWRAHRLDQILHDCWHAGIVLGGESAGSLCWHTAGTTDSHGPVRPFTNGLGWLPHSNAVHYTHRRDHYRHCLATGQLPNGYTTDPGAGLHYENTHLITALSDRPHTNAYHLTRTHDGTTTEHPLPLTRLH